MRSALRTSSEFVTSRPPRIKDRDWFIFEDFTTGATLDDLGLVYDVCRERVRQIVIRVIKISRTRLSERAMNVLKNLCVDPSSSRELVYLYHHAVQCKGSLVKYLLSTKNCGHKTAQEIEHAVNTSLVLRSVLTDVAGSNDLKRH
jgi:hypothetical protein